MSKQVIAVDVDDVLVESAAEIISTYNKRWGTQLSLSAFYATHDEAWGTDEGTAIKRVDEYLVSPEYMLLEPTKAAVESLSTLSKKYELHVLTGRSDVIAGATKDWLAYHFPSIFVSANFSNLYNRVKTRTKGEMCAEIGATVLIDDHLAHLLSAAEYKVEGVLFGDYPWNQADMLPNSVTRCKDWQAVLEYFNGIG